MAPMLGAIAPMMTINPNANDKNMSVVLDAAGDGGGIPFLEKREQKGTLVFLVPLGAKGTKIIFQVQSNFFFTSFLGTFLVYVPKKVRYRVSRSISSSTSISSANRTIKSSSSSSGITR